MTATGQTCDAKRQEFILLSDVLGVSMLVNAMNHHSSRDATVSTILGPVYVSGAKDIEHGADISGHQPSQPTFISGKVCDLNGRPIESAVLDVWHVRPEQRYDVQNSGAGMQFRGKFCTGKDGCYAFRTILPVSYRVPPDGPVGLLLNRTGRHPFRPAHVHFIVSAPGYEQVITNLFVTGVHTSTPMPCSVSRIRWWWSSRATTRPTKRRSSASRRRSSEPRMTLVWRLLLRALPRGPHTRPMRRSVLSRAEDVIQ